MSVGDEVGAREAELENDKAGDIVLEVVAGTLCDRLDDAEYEFRDD